MPLYDFQCASCGRRFEELVKADETPACPACGAEGAQRQQSFSAAVSTTGSRQRALAGARRKAGAMKRLVRDQSRNEPFEHEGSFKILVGEA